MTKEINSRRRNHGNYNDARPAPCSQRGRWLPIQAYSRLFAQQLLAELGYSSYDGIEQRRYVNTKVKLETREDT
jgi:hypothetical protein